MELEVLKVEKRDKKEHLSCPFHSSLKIYSKESFQLLNILVTKITGTKFP